MAARILVVDDERVVADTLTVILRRSGYECLTAYDGCEALSLSHTFCPHLIVSDVMMPKMNGIELLRESRRLLHPPAVLLISGNAEAAGIYEREQPNDHRVQFVSKPVAPPAILALVAGLVSPAAA